MIGLFDSGLGGLTVVKELLRQMSEYDFVYLADTARYPYGDNTPETIQRYAREDSEFLLHKGAQLILAACNTSSSNGIELVRQKMSVPLLDVIVPAIEETVAVTKNGRVGLLATTATVRSGMYKRLLEQFDAVRCFQQACPSLVPFIEEGKAGSAACRNALTQYLAPLLAQDIDTLILGCTHYPLLRPILYDIVGDLITIVDPAVAAVGACKEFLHTHPELNAQLLKTGTAHFFSTRPNAITRHQAAAWLGMPVVWRQATIG